MSFTNAKMAEMTDEDHLILSLVYGTKDGKIKSKITSLRNATMTQIDDIARAETCIANIKEQTRSPPNHIAYKANTQRKECKRCKDTSHLWRSCDGKKLWCEPCRISGYVFGAIFCRSNNKRRSPGRYEGDRRSQSRYMSTDFAWFTP